MGNVTWILTPNSMTLPDLEISAPPVQAALQDESPTSGLSRIKRIAMALLIPLLAAIWLLLGAQGTAMAVGWTLDYTYSVISDQDFTQQDLHAASFAGAEARRTDFSGGAWCGIYRVFWRGWQVRLWRREGAWVCRGA